MWPLSVAIESSQLRDEPVVTWSDVSCGTGRQVGRERRRIMNACGVFALFLLFATAGAGADIAASARCRPSIRHWSVGAVPNPDARAPQYAGSGRPNVSITDFRFSRQDRAWVTRPAPIPKRRRSPWHPDPGLACGYRFNSGGRL